MRRYVQYGCGLTAPKEWINFDASLTLLVESIPIIGKIIMGGKRLFPENVRYGNIVKGLPGIAPNSCDGVFCSHVLEHLSYEQCRIAIAKSYQMLKHGGIFRCIVPDLEYAAREYIRAIDIGNAELKSNAASSFMQATSLGVMNQPKNLLQHLIYNLRNVFGHSKHLWMWDEFSLRKELQAAGFFSVRRAAFHDSADKMFVLVEDAGRFKNAVALEAIK